MAARRATAGLGRRLLAQHGQSELSSVGPSTFTPAVEVPGFLSPEGARHASQLAVKQRMKSVQNIQKITKAMKMVAASKMRVAQVQTERSRSVVEPFIKLLGDRPATEVAKNIIVPISSDRGLCGGINSSVAKYTRALLKVYPEEEGKTSELVITGEKGRAILGRDQNKKITATIADTNKVRITFSQVSLIADDLLKTEYDAVRIVFNRFVSAIAYKPTIATVLSPDSLEKEESIGSKLDEYELEGPGRAEMLQDLAEFQLAVTMYNGLMENNCSEQASRMAAMESSTKNASEMLSKLTLSYNRSRQASITTELIEIISGAAALQG